MTSRNEELRRALAEEAVPSNAESSPAVPQIWEAEKSTRKSVLKTAMHRPTSIARRLAKNYPLDAEDGEKEEEAKRKFALSVISNSDLPDETSRILSALIGRASPADLNAYVSVMLGEGLDPAGMTTSDFEPGEVAIESLDAVEGDALDHPHYDSTDDANIADDDVRLDDALEHLGVPRPIDQETFEEEAIEEEFRLRAAYPGDLSKKDIRTKHRFALREEFMAALGDESPDDEQETAQPSMEESALIADGILDDEPEDTTTAETFDEEADRTSPHRFVRVDNNGKPFAGVLEQA